MKGRWVCGRRGGEDEIDGGVQGSAVRRGERMRREEERRERVVHVVVLPTAVAWRTTSAGDAERRRWRRLELCSGLGKVERGEGMVGGYRVCMVDDMGEDGDGRRR